MCAKTGHFLQFPILKLQKIYKNEADFVTFFILEAHNRSFFATFANRIAPLSEIMAKNELIAYSRRCCPMQTIIPGQREQAQDIARLIMTAMTDECCLNFCGDGYDLNDFLKMMTLLVEREDSQYSYRNTLVAVDGARVVGIAVSYDGSRLVELRRPFLQLAPGQIGQDHSQMDEETQAGELYLDSLAVLPQYRRRGIARRLVLATLEKASRMGLPVGLLVDKGNPSGAAFYDSMGFRFVNYSHWGGHEMKHLLLQQQAPPLAPGSVPPAPLVE